jgi:tetratricopeptide (TPR) repeat protein
MQRTSKALVLLALAAPLLGGCQALFGKSYDASNVRVAPGIGDLAEYGETQLAIGRDALDSGDYGLAIVAFRNAKQAPDQIAAAHNGMAIAYLQLGRPDLAERFFKLAIAGAPGDKRFQANLTRFYGSVPEVAIRTVRESEAELASAATLQAPALALAPQSATIVASSGPSVITAQRPLDRMVRVSSSEVAIRTASALTADPRRRARSAVAGAAPQGRRLNPAYPVKLSFAASAAPASPGYPVRIGFAAAESLAGPAAPAASRIRIGVTDR